MTDIVVLDLLAHTDISGAIRSSYRSPGAAVLGAYFDHYRAANPGGTIVLDAGDLAGAAPVAQLVEASQIVEVFNLLDYDAVTLGNHEFDHGPRALAEMLAPATFPRLCANVVWRNSGDLLDGVQPYVIVEKLGVRVGIIGVTTIYTPHMMFREAFEELEIHDPAAVCNDLIPRLREEGAEIIVVLGHLPGWVNDEGDGWGELFDVAAAVEGIDVLVGGHNPCDIAVDYHGTAVTKTGFSGVSIGHVRLAYDRDTGLVETLLNEIVPVLDGDLDVTPNPAVEAAVARIVAPHAALLDEVIGLAEDELVVERRGEFTIGSIFADCMRDAVDADLAFFNSTSCFGSIPAGPVTVEMVHWVHCFNEHVFVATMRGDRIRAIVELTYDDEHRSWNGDLQFSGLRVVIDPSRPSGARIVSLTLDDGSDLDDTRNYRVATSAYLADGGNGYHELLTGAGFIQTEHLTHDLHVEAIRAAGTIRSAPKERIIELGVSV